jgi:hypothetical protein
MSYMRFWWGKPVEKQPPGRLRRGWEDKLRWVVGSWDVMMGNV